MPAMLAMMLVGCSCAVEHAPDAASTPSDAWRAEELDASTAHDAALDPDAAELDASTAHDAALDPDAGSPPLCDVSAACHPPDGVAIFSAPTLASVTEHLPVAYYDEGRGVGCEWIVLTTAAGGGVSIETAALGPGWSLVPPASFSCVGSRCRLDDAPSGEYRFSVETCSFEGRGGSAGSGSVAIELDTAAQLATLGYLSGPDTGSSPSDCWMCD